MKRFRHLLEYRALSVFTAAVRLLPLSAARCIARRLADLVYYCIPIRRKVVIDNLRAAFGGAKTPREIHAIAHGVYRQFAQTMVELLFFPRLSGEELSRMVRMENTHLLDEALRGGKGAVLVGAHFGNWEMMGAALAQKYPVSFVIGQQENSRVDDLLNSFRTGKGIRLIPLKMALRGVMKALKNNEFIAILADQDAHADGAFVEYFGHPASTPKGPAIFALRAGCPVITGHIFREGDTFRVVFDRLDRPAVDDDFDKQVLQYTAAYTRLLEHYTRLFPDHWFWLHRRWKTRPLATTKSS